MQTFVLLPDYKHNDSHFKVGWGTTATQQVFYNELRNLQATGLSTLGSTLKESFDLLNLYRLQSGIDNYGLVSSNSAMCKYYISADGPFK